MIDRRKFIQAGVAAGLASSVPFRLFIRDAYGETAMVGLSDPFLQPKFVNLVPDALAPGFKYVPDAMGEYKVKMRASVQNTGLVDAGGNALPTNVWGYQDSNVKKSVPTWPGKTFEVQSSLSGGGAPETVVRWINSLPDKGQHLLPVDTNLHWCYSLHGYKKNSIAKNGVPLITHLHGGHTDFQYDGNPEFFYSPSDKKRVVGPQWDHVPGGFTDTFRYDNNVPAGNLWYHDHALGLTRLNVYAGLAGFYFVRDEYDTGLEGNEIGLPAWPYEKAYAIQDRMFRDTGELFYSSMPGEPFYSDFIFDDDGNNILADYTKEFPDGGPTALAEFFGDHMVVNGMIWPKEDVEPRNYRMHLLNGTDSRFMLLEFRLVKEGNTNPTDGTPLLFTVIGSDQGLSSKAKVVQQLMFEPGSRYDVVVDFGNEAIPPDGRVIMTNLLGDSPFGGELPGPDDRFPDSQTDRVMAFDVSQPLSAVPQEFSADRFNGGDAKWNYSPLTTPHTVTRKVALFEGLDEFGRLQPLLGHFDETDGLFKAVAWHTAATETPALDATEIWEIYNFTGDAHPVHLHLVNFEILGRRMITFEEDGNSAVEQHNGAFGTHPKVINVEKVEGPNGVPELESADAYVENAPKDMVTALPDQVTRIKATFDKSGRYVWHCHILSHEDHEMMRVLHVG